MMVNSNASEGTLEVSVGRADEIISAACDTNRIARICEILDSIETDRWLEDTKKTLRQAIQTGVPCWDLCSVLAAYTEVFKPRRYLEIGVRRGRSAAIVAGLHPDIDLYLFDMWYPDYAGAPNPGPDFVRGQLRRVGHRGMVYIGSGRSQDVIPAFFADPHEPDQFDLITVDGDHRDAGARADLENVIPHLSVGGMLVFDDIAHEEFPALHRVWRDACAQFSTLTTRENLSGGTGTAIAVRQH